MKFQKLEVWQLSFQLSCSIYKETKELRDWGFKDQITRSGLSVPSNIAEGEERETAKEKIRFLYYAKGSLGELVTQLYIGIEIGYLEKHSSMEMVKEAKELAKILGSLIKNKESQIREDNADYNID